MPTIQNAVKQMIDLKGFDVFKDSKKFFAFLDDLSPEYLKERRMIKRIFDDDLLGLFIDETKSVRHRVRKIREQLQDFGLSDDNIYFILESLGIPLGWGQEILDLKDDFPIQISSYSNQSKKQNSVDSSITDVALNDDTLKQLGIMDKNSVPSVFDIPSIYQLYSGKYRVTKIDDRVLKDCDKLQCVIIPNTVTEIGDSAFENCKALEKINIPDSITKIGDRAFANCKLLSVLIIPNSVTEIGKSAFGGCSSLNSAVIPNKITKISEGLFGICKSILNVSIPNGVTEIEDFAFAGCESLSSLIIPKTVTKIGSRAFANCKSLDVIVIPNGVTNIGVEAFGGCSKLQVFTLPTRFTIFKDDVNRQIDLKIKVQQQFQQVLTSKQVSQNQSSLSSNPFASAKVGDYVKFGNYPQTANGQNQPIEWQVLSKENNKMLVISRYGLDAKRFDSGSNNWANSEIRKWLNGEFYNKAFTDQEKKSIKSSSLSDVGTTDNVFLLSGDDWYGNGEVNEYFANDEARKCKATDYAVKNGAYVADNGYSWWWLRSPNPGGSVYDVDIDGDVDYDYVCSTDFLVRPALYINL